MSARVPADSRFKAMFLLALGAALGACDPGDGSDEPAGTESATDEGSEGTGGPAGTDSGGSSGVDESGSDGSDGSSGGPAGPEHHPYTGNYDLQSFDVTSTAAFVGDVAIAVGDDGDVHIAFTDREFNGGWRLQYAHRPFGADDFESTTLWTIGHEPVEVFVDTTGAPCVVSVRADDSVAAPSDLLLSCRSADDTWTDEVIVPFGGALDDTLDLDLTMDLDGEPALSYLHPNTGEVTTARRSGGTWSMDTIALVDVALVHSNAIAIDDNNEAHLAMWGFSTLDPTAPVGVYYAAPDGTVAFGPALGSSASDDVDMALVTDDAPLISRADGAFYELDYDDNGIPYLPEFEQGENIVQMRVRYDPTDDLTFRTYSEGNLAFDVRQGGGVYTKSSDPGSGALLEPALAHGQLHLVHWEGAGVPPMMRYTVATPI